MRLANPLLLSLRGFRAMVEPEIRGAVFGTQAHGPFDLQVDAVVQGREEGGVEGG